MLVRRATTAAALSLSLIAAVVAPMALAQQAPDTPARPKTSRDFRPRKLMSPRRAIVDAPFISAAEVKDQVTDNELVLGIVIDGKARAYPINMLTGPSREIINDTLAGQPIAGTW